MDGWIGQEINPFDATQLRRDALDWLGRLSVKPLNDDVRLRRGFRPVRWWDLVLGGRPTHH